MARLFDLPETKGTFEVRGITSRTESQGFFREITTRNNQPFRIVNFGMTYDDGQTIYMDMNGMPRDSVWFSKRNENGKTETMKAPWEQRDQVPEGYQLIGTTIALSKKPNKDGQMINDSRTMTEFDACEYLHLNLKDDVSMRVRGNTSFSHYIDKNGNKSHSVRYTPNRMYLATRDIDFSEYDGDKKKPVHNFTQTIVFTGITKETDDVGKATGRFLLSAKIVNYSTIEDAEFVIENPALANNFRKQIKPYTAIQVWGEITPHHQTETVVDPDDCWGEQNTMQRVTGATKVEMIITGADPKTRDTGTYTQSAIEEALKKIEENEKAEKNYNVTNSKKSSDIPWGEDMDNDDDEEDW